MDRRYLWNRSPLEEVRVLQDEERGEVEYVSCADCFAFFLVCHWGRCRWVGARRGGALFSFQVGEVMGRREGRGFL